jgi:hypothetical protein
MPKTGTMRKTTIKGVDYLFAGDADLNETLTEFENDLVVTSGVNMIKQEKQAQLTEDVALVTTASDRENLKATADSGDEITFSYVTRNGDTYRSQGQINVDNNQTMTSTTTIKYLPTIPWTASLV